MNEILVPFDFNSTSHNALDYAFFLADKWDSKITVVHVLAAYPEAFEDKEHVRAMEESWLARETEQKHKLESLVETGKTRGLNITSEIIKSIDVPAGILDYLKSGDFDIVVMGNRAKTMLNDWIIGTVPEKIIRLSPVPVITVPEDWVKRDLKTLLVPIDFSEGSGFANKQAHNWFAGFHAKLKIIFVIEEDDYPDVYSIRFHFEKDENQKLKNIILETLSDFTGIPPDQAEYIIRVGQSHEEIKECAEEGSVDLIAMPKKGQSLFERILIGSTTERVIRISSCPVLTVPFSTKNTSKIDYHFRFRQFLAKYIVGIGRTGQ